MQKTNTKLWVRFVPLLLVLVLVIAACSNGDDNGGDDGPTSNTQPTVTITPTTFAGALPEDGDTGDDDEDETGGGDTGGEDTGGSVVAQQTAPNVATFTATGSDTDGDTLEYSWEASDPSVELSATSGEAITATFTEEGDYTVTVTVDDQTGEANATNSAAASANIVGPGEDPVEPDDPTGGGGDTGGDPDGTNNPTLTSFGVSSSEEGPFLNDGPDGISEQTDERVLQIDPGDTFYLQVAVSDANGINDITVQLRNVDTEDTPDGENNVTPLVEGTETEGFTLGAPTGCTIPTTEATATCVYPIVTSADADESNLTTGEFSYVFRVQIDGQNIGGSGNRGYVNTSN